MDCQASALVWKWRQSNDFQNPGVISYLGFITVFDVDFSPAIKKARINTEVFAKFLYGFVVAQLSLTSFLQNS